MKDSNDKKCWNCGDGDHLANLCTVKICKNCMKNERDLKLCEHTPSNCPFKTHATAKRQAQPSKPTSIYAAWASMDKDDSVDDADDVTSESNYEWLYENLIYDISQLYLDTVELIYSATIVDRQLLIDISIRYCLTLVQEFI